MNVEKEDIMCGARKQYSTKLVMKLGAIWSIVAIEWKDTDKISWVFVLPKIIMTFYSYNPG